MEEFISGLKLSLYWQFLAFAGDLGCRNFLVASHGHFPLWQMCHQSQIWQNPIIHMPREEGWVSTVLLIATGHILPFPGHLLLGSQRNLPTEAVLLQLL